LVLVLVVVLLLVLVQFLHLAVQECLLELHLEMVTDIMFLHRQELLLLLMRELLNSL
jgi:hypothetical protein